MTRRRRVALDEGRVGGPARERLDAGRAAAREQVEDPGARQVGLEDGEQRLLDAVAERPRALRRAPARRSRAPSRR